MTVALPARAKLNLDLEVLARRDDGFHELRTTYQAIELHDLLVMSRAQGETTLEISGLRIEGQSQNSVLLAHRVLESAARRSLPTRFHLHKRIPPGSGMGGASSDAATALRGLAAMYGIDEDLEELARQVGADVPFFVHGGAARAEGLGERLVAVEQSTAWYAIVWPGIELSTSDVYRAWDEVEGDGPNQLRRAAEKVEPALREFAERLGEGWQMTGSGSAFFRPFAERHEALQATTHLECWTAVSRAVGRW